MSVTPITQSNIQTAVNAWVGGDTTTYGHISDWDTSAVTDMSYLFNGKSTFNDDISNWDVSNVTTLEAMFMGTIGQTSSKLGCVQGDYNVGCSS